MIEEKDDIDFKNVLEEEKRKDDEAKQLRDDQIKKDEEFVKMLMENEIKIREEEMLNEAIN